MKEGGRGFFRWWWGGSKNVSAVRGGGVDLEELTKIRGDIEEV
ncbi:hypothetical protein [Bartonella taylorii]|nr:hypothetical protein [Bartonella taylorii]